MRHERIWLQYKGHDSDDTDCDDDNCEQDEITWCQTQQFDTDVEYLRADLVAERDAEIERLRADNATLRADAERRRALIDERKQISDMSRETGSDYDRCLIALRQWERNVLAHLRGEKP